MLLNHTRNSVPALLYSLSGGRRTDFLLVQQVNRFPHCFVHTENDEKYAKRAACTQDHHIPVQLNYFDKNREGADEHKC